MNDLFLTALLFDAAIVVISLIFCIIGYWRGFFHSIIDIVGFVAAVFCGRLFSPYLSPYYYEWIFRSDESVKWKLPASTALAFLTIFLITIFAVWIVKIVISLVMKIEPLRFMDKMLGLLFGLCFAFLFCEVLSFGFDKIYPYLQSLNPEYFRDGLIDRTYVLRFFRDFNLVPVLLNGII